jgi:hypothetical protein
VVAVVVVVVLLLLVVLVLLVLLVLVVVLVVVAVVVVVLVSAEQGEGVSVEEEFATQNGQIGAHMMALNSVGAPDHIPLPEAPLLRFLHTGDGSLLTHTPSFDEHINAFSGSGQLKPPPMQHDVYCSNGRGGTRPLRWLYVRRRFRSAVRRASSLGIVPLRKQPPKFSV